MRLPKLLIGSIILLFSCSSVAFAQIDMGKLGKRVFDRGGDKVQDETEEAVGEKVEEEIEMIFNRSKRNDTTTNSGRRRRAGSKLVHVPNPNQLSKCTEQNDYQFTDDFILKMTTVKKSDEAAQEAVIRCYVGNENNALAYKFEEMKGRGASKVEGMIMVVDPTDSINLMLMESEGKKMGFCSKGHVSEPSAEQDHSDVDLKAEGWKKTGRTEMIAGVECHEYTKQDSVAIQSVWAASDGGPVHELMNTMKRNKQMGSPMGVMAPFEFIMRMKNESVTDGDINTIEVTEYNKGSRELISVKEYTFF